MFSRSWLKSRHDPRMARTTPLRHRARHGLIRIEVRPLIQAESGSRKCKRSSGGAFYASGCSINGGVGCTYRRGFPPVSVSRPRYAGSCDQGRAVPRIWRVIPCGPDRLAGVTQDADLTGLLRAWSDGDAGALEQFAPLVHRELRAMARRMLAGERLAIGWQPTDLVGESYVRLLDWHAVHWQNRAHFFATTAQMMRRVLVDAARARQAAKRGQAVEGWWRRSETRPVRRSESDPLEGRSFYALRALSGPWPGVGAAVLQAEPSPGYGRARLARTATLPHPIALPLCGEDGGVMGEAVE